MVELQRKKHKGQMDADETCDAILDSFTTRGRSRSRSPKARKF